MATSTRPSINAEHREITGKQVSRLRRAGMLPGVVYGRGVDSENVQVEAKAFDLLRRHAGRNALVDLHVGDRSARPVLLQAIQEHPVTRRPLHVDFFIVRMTEERTVDVPVHFFGTSEAAEKQGGTLLHLRDAIQVRALPADLPQSVELDVTSLMTFDDVLHVRDIVIPERVTLVTDPDEAIARVQPPRIEEEPVVAAEEAPEGEAPAEGAEAAEGGAGEGESGEPGETGDREGSPRES